MHTDEALLKDAHEEDEAGEFVEMVTDVVCEAIGPSAKRPTKWQAPNIS